MSDDGTGLGLRIPSVLISKKDGDILKEFLLQKIDGDGKESPVQATAYFEMNNPDNEVDVKVWYTSNDPRSLLFVRDIGQYVMRADKSKRGIDFEPKFVHWSCPSCDSDFKR